jgi:hypothetical protein
MIKLGLMKFENYSDSSDALFSLIQQIKLGYQEIQTPTKRGRKPDFSTLSFLLLAVVAVVTKTYSDSELHRLLLKDRQLLRVLEFPRVPHRTWILRCLKSLLPRAEEQVSLLGRQILAEVEIPQEASQVSATDGRMYQSIGPKWHKKDRQKGQIPLGLRNVDRESSWSKSGYRGWVQGYRLTLQTLVFPAPVPLFAVWRDNSLSEASILLEELKSGHFQVTEVNLGDTRLGDLELPRKYQEKGGYLLTPAEFSKKRKSWKNDLYEYRRETIELLFQRIIQAFDLKTCQVKGKAKNGTFVITSVWVYQILWLNNYRNKKPLADVKEQIENARLRLKL